LVRLAHSKVALYSWPPMVPVISPGLITEDGAFSPVGSGVSSPKYSQLNRWSSIVKG
jgi:hypothetical protein